MAKFLDKHGLSTYESSIKERLNEKQDVLVSGDTIKTVNNQSLLGSGNISISSGVTSYNDLTDKPTIPDELSDLTDDSTHRLVTDTEKSTWNNKSDFSGSYNDLTNKPIYDASYIADAVGSTITNAQYEEFKNAFFSGIIIVVYGAVAALGTRDSGGVQYKTLSMNNANSVGTLIISPINNNHTVTLEELELAQTTDVPTATSDLTNDSGFITTESDPVFMGSPAANILTSDITHWNNKQDELVSGTNIKTINSQSIVGSGNVDFYGTELPIGTEVDYDGSTVPSGWVETENRMGKLLWEGSFDSGSITVPGINQYIIIALVAGSVTMLGSQLYGGCAFAQYNSYNTVAYGYRFTYDAPNNKLTIDNLNRGANNGSAKIPVTKIYGIV